MSDEDDDRRDSDIDNEEDVDEEESKDIMDVDDNDGGNRNDRRDIGKGVPIKERLTSRFLSKYERVRIIGERAIQLSNNAVAMVEVDDDMWDPLKIAEKELKERKIPFQIRRYLPNGDYEDWNVNDLIFD